MNQSLKIVTGKLELLIRHLGLSKEKQTVELEGGVGIVNILERGRRRAGLEDDD